MNSFAKPISFGFFFGIYLSIPQTFKFLVGVNLRVRPNIADEGRHIGLPLQIIIKRCGQSFMVARKLNGTDAVHGNEKKTERSEYIWKNIDAPTTDYYEFSLLATKRHTNQSSSHC